MIIIIFAQNLKAHDFFYRNFIVRFTLYNNSIIPSIGTEEYFAQRLKKTIGAHFYARRIIFVFYHHLNIITRGCHFFFFVKFSLFIYLLLFVFCIAIILVFVFASKTIDANDKIIITMKSTIFCGAVAYFGWFSGWGRMGKKRPKL